MKLSHRFSQLLDDIWESPHKDFLLPISLLFGPLLNFGLFYVGCAYQENAVRTYGFILGQLIFLALCGLAFLSAVKHTRLSKRFWICLGIIVLFYGCYFAIGLARFGLDDILKDYCTYFACIISPFLAGVYGAVSRSDQKFFPLMEKISFFVFPAGLIYFNGLIFNCNPFRVPYTIAPYLGMFGYATIAYTTMPLLFAHIVQFSVRGTLELPITHKNASHPQLLRAIFIAIYWVAIIGSGTRGAYVGIAGFCILFVLSQLIHREPVGRAFILSSVLAAVLLFNIFVYAPPAMSAVHRMDMVFEGLKQGQLITARGETEGIQDKLDELVDAGIDQQVTSSHPEQQPANQDEPGTGSSSEMLKIGNRGTLLKLGQKEFLNSPLTGMGPGRFEFKYGLYPHNILWELFADTGLSGTVPMLLLVFFIFFKLLKAGWKDRAVRYYFLFLLAFAIRTMTVDRLCDSVVFLGGLGYGIAFQEFSDPLKKTEKLAAVPEDSKTDEKK